MSSKERGFITAVLAVISLMIAIDLISDLSEGLTWSHLFIEGTIALSALVGIFLLLRGSFTLRHSLVQEKQLSSERQVEVEKWRSQSKKYIEGLSQTIDAQLTSWKLSGAEKEVVFLLLKGLSLQEIADVRGTTEKTARAQSVSVYSKAGLSSRSELAAFFLEDLLPPYRQSEIATAKGLQPS